MHSLIPESIESFIEDQAFSRSYDFAPPPPLPSVSSTGDTQEDWERETTCWREREEVVGEEPKSYDRKKAWHSMNHLILPYTIFKITSANAESEF